MIPIVIGGEILGVNPIGRVHVSSSLSLNQASLNERSNAKMAGVPLGVANGKKSFLMAHARLS
jgi:hypothetical protein